MSELDSILTTAAAEAQAVLGESLTGPDGRPYTGVFRSASAFEQAAAGQEMQSHGYGDKTLMVVAITRAQFGAPPYDWRRKKLFRGSTPPQEFSILTLNTDDRFWYIFPIVFRQPAG